MKNKSQNQVEYRISSTELTCINVLIKTIEVAINRKTFSESELQGIYKTIDLLTRSKY